jgi:ribosome-associated protein
MGNFESKFNIEKEGQAEDPQEFVVPETEISERFSRSGGHGGQNVNKLATKAEVRWNIDESRAFSEEEKEKIRRVLGNRINKEGELIIVSQEERSQLQNRQRAVERLNGLVAAALTLEKERIPTRPTRASRERRLEEKRKLGEKKKWRTAKAEY